MPEQQTDLERMLEAMVEMRELVKEAHSAIRDLKYERKELKREREEFVGNEELIRRLDKAAADGITEFSEAILKSIRKSEQNVADRFDEIMLICLGEDPESVRKGQKSVTELIRNFVRTRRIPIKVTEEIHLMCSAETAREQNQESEAMINGVRRFPFGKAFNDLPILIDNRVPKDNALLVLPPVTEKDKRIVIELNLRTGENADVAVAALDDMAKRRAAQIPAAFGGSQKQRKGTRPA